MLAFVIESVDTLPYANAPLYEDLTINQMDSFRNYTVYNCEDKVASTYTLVADVDRYTMPRAGTEDDRQLSDEIPVVELAVEGGSGYGTGFIVDDHVIATAAHCVYSKGTSSFVSPIVVNIKNADSTKVLNTVTAKEVHVLSDYIRLTDSNEYSKYDYALIYVGEDVKLSNYGMFTLGVPSDEFMTSGSRVVASGFPGKVDGKDNSGLRYNAAGDIVSIQDYEQYLLDITGKHYVLRNHQIQYTAYVSEGDSGGPVYIKQTFDDVDYYTAIGITTSGVAPNFYGTRMTTNLLHFYYNNDYIGSTIS